MMNFNAGIQHRQKFKLVICGQNGDFDLFSYLANVRLEDNEVFASDMTDIGLQFHEPDAAPIPVTFLPVVLQKFAIIESRAE